MGAQAALGLKACQSSWSAFWYPCIHRRAGPSLQATLQDNQVSTCPIRDFCLLAGKDRLEVTRAGVLWILAWLYRNKVQILCIYSGHAISFYKGIKKSFDIHFQQQYERMIYVCFLTDVLAEKTMFLPKELLYQHFLVHHQRQSFLTHEVWSLMWQCMR